MKKPLLLLSIISLFFSCKKEASRSIQPTQSVNQKSNKEIQDSIRKKQEQDVINMDTDLKESKKSLDKDLNTMK
ncbi:hypothetical protein NZD88_20830 [Chryseobacterium antibioticum]|uniref:Lipoprotein n=1 Tax=Chryseobacterium pyrolae TaxID=2987481 RepID=A0ABT2IMV6_9FLAO|nr:hypothetical protein [Chryseobacterium pyrolae]MCT2410008.1 hypothetical protein [Chryseobacterium pyrolae]